MVVSIRNLALVSAFLPAAFAGADPAARLAGHWEGAIHAPARGCRRRHRSRGRRDRQARRHVQQPVAAAEWLSAVERERRRRDREGRAQDGGPGVQTFDGRFSEDGQTIKGQFLIDVHAVPFTLKRNGDARIAPPPRSAAIDAKLAGSWSGALIVGAQSLPLAA